MLREDVKEKHYARFEGSPNYSWWDHKGQTKLLPDGMMHVCTENRTPMSHHASRCDKNVTSRVLKRLNKSWWDPKGWSKICQHHWSLKYRSKVSGSRCGLKRMSGRSTMQGLKVLPTIVDHKGQMKLLPDRMMHVCTENRTPMSQYASRCDKNVTSGVLTRFSFDFA